MNGALGARLLRVVLLAGAVLTQPAAAQNPQPPGGPADARRLQLIGQMPRAEQLAATTQNWLVAWMRYASRLYQQRLDGLACEGLFSLGNPALFSAVVGAAPGQVRHAVFILGDGNPRLDVDETFVFPANTYLNALPRADVNTYWHESQHGLLTDAGLGVGVDAYRASMDNADDADDQHPFIEGVGQRGAEAYATLLAFEDAVRRADRVESAWIAQGRDPADFAWQRQAWGLAHQRFSAFLGAMRRVANMPPDLLQQYRDATGVWFSSAEQVAEFYRTGGLKRQERGELLGIQPPRWVFAGDLPRMPVRILLSDAQRRDLEEAGSSAAAPFEVRNGVFSQTLLVRVRAVGSVLRATAGQSLQSPVNRAIAGMVTRGRLRIRLIEDDPYATLAVVQGVNTAAAGVGVAGGSSAQLFDLDMARNQDVPIRLTIYRRQLSQLTKPATYHVEFQYSDQAADAVYEASASQLAITVGPGAAANAAGKAAEPPTAPKAPEPTPARATAEPGEIGSAAERAARTPLGVVMRWRDLPGELRVRRGSYFDPEPHPPLPSSFEMPLNNGPSVYFAVGERGRGSYLMIEVYGRVLPRNYATVEEYLTGSAGSDERAQRYWRSFRNSETRFNGMRAFETISQGWEDRGGQHHWVIEVDPVRHIYVSVLTAQNTVARGSTEPPAFNQVVLRFMRSISLRASGATPAPIGAVAGTVSSALAVSSRGPLTLPRALTATPIAENELLERPPAGPAPNSRRKRGGEAASPTVPAPPKPARAVPPGPPATPYATAAGTDGMLHGRGSIERINGSQALSLTNDSRAHWTRCRVIAPSGRQMDIGTLPALTGRDYSLRPLATTMPADGLTSVRLECREGWLTALKPR